MKIQRTIPPAAAPLYFNELWNGLAGDFSGRHYIRRLTEEINKYFDVKHVFLVSSGKAALFLILQSLKSLAPEKREVLIPAYTCFSVPSAIVKAGLRVSLCDIESSTFDFDYKVLKEAINEKTLCIIPDHLFGIPSDMDKVNSLCKTKGIFVVEDAAQAMGGMYKGKMLGTIGDVGFFSLGRGKNITCGSGGIIITNSDIIASAIAKKYSDLKSPGAMETIKEFLKMLILSIFINPSLYWLPSALPFLRLGETVFDREFPIRRLSGMQAGLLRGWQKKLEESNRIRRENSKYFCSTLASTLTFHNGASIPYLRLPILAKNRGERDQLFFISRRRGSGFSVMYPTPVNEIEEIKDLFNGKEFPYAKKVSETLLTIPTHNLLSNEDKERISRQLSAIN